MSKEAFVFKLVKPGDWSRYYVEGRGQRYEIVRREETFVRMTRSPHAAELAQITEVVWVVTRNGEPVTKLRSLRRAKERVLADLTAARRAS